MHIDKYEKETGNNVTHIALQHDISPVWSHEAVRFSAFDTGVRALVVTWSVRGLLYLAGYPRPLLQPARMDEEIFNTHFAGRNWDRFVPEEQMYFRDNTLYLMLY